MQIFANSSEVASSSANAYWALRRSTFPFTGPCTRLMNLPDGDKKHRLTPLSAQSFISPGLAPMYPKVTIDSMLSTEIRNTSC